MTITNDLVLYAVLFVAIMMITKGLVDLIAARLGGKAAVERRLAPEESAQQRRDNSAVLRAPSDEDADGSSLLLSFKRLIYAADSKATPLQMMGIMAAVALGVFGVIMISPAPIPGPIALVLGAAAGVGGVLFVLSSRRAQRIAKFEQQFPDALDAMVRALRVGQPVRSTLNVVAREMPHPINTEFRIAFDDVTYGQSLDDALNDMCARVPSDDLRYFAVAVSIQEASGGNLAEILSGLSNLIRDRFRMFRKVKAATTEGRMSAWFLSLFPFALAALVQFVRPDYYTQVMDSPMFMPLAALVVILLGVNIIAMKIMTKIDV